MISAVTSYNNATVGSGTVVNDVKLEDKNLGQLVNDYQSHSGAVNTGTTPKAQYTYADGSANQIRPLTMVYPDGRVLTFDYGILGGTDDLVSRATALKIASTVITAYSYLGLSSRVRVQFNEPGMELTYIKQGAEPVGDGGDQYTGWDRFGRVIDQRWLQTSTGTALERVQYGFDRSSNRVYRHNLVAVTGQDEYYTYDNVSEVLTMQRGTLNTNVPPDGISGTPVREEDFTYDPLGNWKQYVVKVSGATTLNQTRTHNKANEITKIDGSTSYTAQDAAGNTTKTPKVDNWLAALNLTFDAWNRIATVKDGVTILGTYRFDGMNRRVTNAGASTRHYYYSQQWQILEERVGTATTMDRQFVWGLRYIDDLVFRDDPSARHYVLQDYFQPTAITDTSGTVEERYGYDSFGQPRFMDASFGPLSSSGFEWETLYGAYRWDSESGLYQVRNRDLHPKLGRWTSRYPIDELGGINLYAYCTNGPINAVDFLGLNPVLSATLGCAKDIIWEKIKRKVDKAITS